MVIIPLWICCPVCRNGRPRRPFPSVKRRIERRLSLRTGHGNLDAASAVSQIDPYLKGQLGAWMGAVEARDPEMFYRITYPVNFSESWIAANAEALAAARERYESLNMTALLELLKSFSNLDITADLQHITAPTLVMHRTRDRAIPMPLGRYIADHITGARFVEVPGEDHLLWTQGADAILDEIEQFLTGTRQSRPPERMLATVLFTDIVDSTGTAARLGDRDWRQLLDRHDAMVRERKPRPS